MVGLHRFASARVHAHHDDLLGLHSIEGFMTVYGMPPDIEAVWRPQVVEEFQYTARPDATGFADGDVFPLGGTRIEIVHLPGHTRGHSGFLIEPDGILFVADVDLSSFGPYYGDHWSSLTDFEKAIDRCREIEAKWYVTSHHKGVVTGREEFLRQLDAFAAIIGDRERRLLAFLAEPRTLDEIVAHRFVYRPGVDLPFVDVVERRSMAMHLDRLVPEGAVVEVEPGRYRAG
jgi:glyoxylase-like metal-dependent hydrolase (beta-lactamase superfamily II)